MTVLLPLTKLQLHNACSLSQRIEKFRRFHGYEPDEFTTLQQWLAVTPALCDRVWALSRLYGKHGRNLAIMMVIKAVRRVLPIFEQANSVDSRPRKVLEMIETWLKNPTRIKKAGLKEALGADFYNSSVGYMESVIIGAAALNLIRAILFISSPFYSTYLTEALRLVLTVATHVGTRRTEQRRQQRDFAHAVRTLERGE